MSITQVLLEMCFARGQDLTALQGDEAVQDALALTSAGSKASLLTAGGKHRRSGRRSSSGSSPKAFLPPTDPKIAEAAAVKQLAEQLKQAQRLLQSKEEELKKKQEEARALASKAEVGRQAGSRPTGRWLG